MIRPTLITLALLGLAAAALTVAWPGESRGQQDAVGTSEEPPEVETRVYNIRDLLVQLPQFSDAPGFGRPETRFGSEDEPVGGIFGADEEAEGDLPMSRAERLDEIWSLISETVGESSQWHGHSSLRTLDGNLYVTTTEANHKQVADRLDQLRSNQPGPIAMQGWVVRMPGKTLHRLNQELAGGDLILDPEAADKLLGRLFNDEAPGEVVASVSQVGCDGQRAYAMTTRQTTRRSERDGTGAAPAATRPAATRPGADDPPQVVTQSGLIVDVEPTLTGDGKRIITTIRASLGGVDVAARDAIRANLTAEWRGTTTLPEGGALLMNSTLEPNADAHEPFVLILRLTAVQDD
jgi:hypothetical protein